MSPEEPQPDQMADELAQLRARLDELERANRELKRVCADRDAFEYTGTAMMVIEEDMTISVGNRTMLEITGHSNEELRIAHTWTDYVADEDRERMIEYHRRRRESADTQPAAYEFKLKDPRGGLRDVLAHVSMIPGTRKSIVSLVDISDRKRMEEAIRESEERYRDLFENANDIIYIHDFEGRFISVNGKGLRTYGFSREETPRTAIHDIVDAAFLSQALESVRRKVDGEGMGEPYELLTRTRDGREVWVEVNTRLISRNGRPEAVQGIARDITERKAAEKALSESQRRFRETTELLPAIICELDQSRRISYVNRLGLETFGYTAEDVAEGVYIDDLVHPDDWPLMRERFERIARGELPGPQEYRMLHKDGAANEYLLNSSPVTQAGTVVGLRTCLLDIHERNDALRKLEESEERFRAVYSQSPVGIALFTESGACLDANQAFREMLPGACREDGQQGVLFSLISLDDSSRATFMSGGHVQCEGRLSVTAADVDEGESRYYSWHLTRLRGRGESRGVLLVQVMDITERKAAEARQLSEAQRAADEARRLVADLRKDMMQTFSFNNMVSRSPKMREVFDLLPQIAETPATVLVCGESGTGKELIAKSIHELSPRRDKPFVAINCSALPDALLESELFGYKAGAFTDAKRDKPGKFALADSGTIFLDEIGDISPAMQVKLLRVLQERAYEPLGATSSAKVDVRVVAATNRNLPQMVRDGAFREDLYYRIKVLQINLPPLKERLSDIPLLAAHFVERFNSRYGKDVREISHEAQEVLLAHSYPGNIRELENTIEHAFVFCKGPTIGPEHLPAELRASFHSASPQGLAAVKSFDELEKLYIESVLAETGGNRLRAAQRLGIHKATLFRKILKYGLK